jgi:hypothetical protein
LANGRTRLVRHGHGPERINQTGIGAEPVKRAKLRERHAKASGDHRIALTSAIPPKSSRRTKSLDPLLPVLYLHGISIGYFQKALAALFRKVTPNLSSSVMGCGRKGGRRTMIVGSTAISRPAATSKLGRRGLSPGAHG